MQTSEYHEYLKMKSRFREEEKRKARERGDSGGPLNPIIVPAVTDSRTSPPRSTTSLTQEVASTIQSAAVVRPESPVVVRKRMRMFHNPYYKPPVVVPDPSEKAEIHPILPASIRPSTSYSSINKFIIPRTRPKKFPKIELDPNPHTSLMLMILQMLTKDRPTKGHLDSMQNVCCRLCDCSEEHMYNLYLHDVSMKSTGSSHEAQPGQEAPQNDIIHQSSYELKELLKRLARTTPKGENPSHEDMTNLAFLCIKLALSRGEYKKPWFKFAKKTTKTSSNATRQEFQMSNSAGSSSHMPAQAIVTSPPVSQSLVLHDSSLQGASLTQYVSPLMEPTAVIEQGVPMSTATSFNVTPSDISSLLPLLPQSFSFAPAISSFLPNPFSTTLLQGIPDNSWCAKYILSLLPPSELPQPLTEIKDTSYASFTMIPMDPTIVQNSNIIQNIPLASELGLSQIINAPSPTPSAFFPSSQAIPHGSIVLGTPRSVPQPFQNLAYPNTLPSTSIAINPLANVAHQTLPSTSVAINPLANVTHQIALPVSSNTPVVPTIPDVSAENAAFHVSLSRLPWLGTSNQLAHVSVRARQNQLLTEILKKEEEKRNRIREQ